ncbi:MAG: hypothetical protein ACXADF_14940 [Candidatus Thorarchaeota archaeon]|jgi:hypothetical protein
MDKIGNFLSGVFQWMFALLILAAAWHISPCVAFGTLIVILAIRREIRKG